MTDQIPADKVREIATAMRAAMRRVEDDYPDGEFLMDMSDYIRDLDKLCARARPRPTLADMTEEECAACQWMQADTEQWGRAVIIIPNLSDGRAALLDRRGKVPFEEHGTITPRPDLPRLEWPGTEKPAPTGLPEGFLLADHRIHGRVIVTTPEPDKDGTQHAIYRDDSMTAGYDWGWYEPEALTFLDGPAAPVEVAPGVVVGRPITDPDTLRWVSEHAPDGTIVVDWPESSVTIRNDDTWHYTGGYSDSLGRALGYALGPRAPITVVRWGGGDQ